MAKMEIISNLYIVKCGMEKKERKKKLHEEIGT